MYFNGMRQQTWPAQQGSAVPETSAAPGIQLAITDVALQAYLQRYPFATGPDPVSNAAGLRSLSDNLHFKPACARVATTLLPPDATCLPAEEKKRLEEVFTEVQLSFHAQAIHYDDFGWEANLVPRAARNVLILGCGDGIELLFLRAVLPSACLTAIDYHDSLLPGIAAATGVTLLVGDMQQHLRALDTGFDLVFSNHTLEHLYDPRATLAHLHTLLAPGGHILSTLPLMSAPGTPFLHKSHDFLAHRTKLLPPQVHPLDAIYFDLGHPWKTNAADLADTLIGACFEDIEIFQRRDHLCRPTAGGAAAIRRVRTRYLALHALLLAPLRFLLRHLTPRSLLPRICSIFFAIERRLPFGANRLMNALSEEALFLATVPVGPLDIRSPHQPH